mmetsp:Transcript_29485/g.44768  ORF Transcript_29485/g.44768 Transcript_29485/m.44768 type:complete len:95 (+) Transcript_29485:1769-2053(+)
MSNDQGKIWDLFESIMTKIRVKTEAYQKDYGDNKLPVHKSGYIICEDEELAKLNDSISNYHRQEIERVIDTVEKEDLRMCTEQMLDSAVSQLDI